MNYWESYQNIRKKKKKKKSWSSSVVHNNVGFKFINQYNKNKNRTPKMLEILFFKKNCAHIL